MTAKIIAVAQQKGGAGKTTVAAHLGMAWAGKGKQVVFFDVDPQQSLAAWYDLRREVVGESDNLTFAAFDGWKASSEIARAKRHADVIVVDSPPHAETAARVAVREADLVVVPAQLSPMDIWAMRSTLDLAEKARSAFLVVLNRVPPRSRVADDLKASLKKDKIPLAKTTLGNRTAFAASLMAGKGVTEAQPRGLAAKEIGALANEIWRKA